jgi:proline iminopeptidase
MQSSTSLRELYPPIEPYDTGRLKVSDIHELYYEQCGNPQGKPAVVLHGGPGGGIAPFYRQFFDPTVYRVILFDQRGAGQSTPFACLEDNTTWHLVEDIEKIRKHLDVDKWVVFGGSWGAGLGIAYAEKYPDRVKALVLRGIFTLRREELLWFYQEGASFIFPDAWEKYLAPIPEVERGDLMSAYYRRLTGSDPKVQLECAKAWTTWEMSTSRLYIDPATVERGEDDKFALAFARIESHYFVHGGFFEYEGQLIKEAHKIAHIPATIAQGRYDMVCPMRTAWDLHKVWPSAELVIIPDAGHSAKEPGIIRTLVSGCEKYRHL